MKGLKLKGLVYNSNLSVRYSGIHLTINQYQMKCLSFLYGSFIGQCGKWDNGSSGGVNDRCTYSMHFAVSFSCITSLGVSWYIFTVLYLLCTYMRAYLYSILHNGKINLGLLITKLNSKHKL